MIRLIAIHWKVPSFILDRSALDHAFGAWRTLSFVTWCSHQRQLHVYISALVVYHELTSLIIPAHDWTLWRILSCTGNQRQCSLQASIAFPRDCCYKRRSLRQCVFPFLNSSAALRPRQSRDIRWSSRHTNRHVFVCRRQCGGTLSDHDLY